MNEAQLRRRQKKKVKRTFRPRLLDPGLHLPDPTVRVLKKYGRFNRWAKEKGFLKNPVSTLEDPFECYDVNSGGVHADLSPMILGPVLVGGVGFACNIEDGWQGSKVWSFHMRGRFAATAPGLWVDDPSQQRHDPTGEAWLPEWQKWSEHIRFGGEAKRHRAKIDEDAVNPKVPLFSYWQGERLDYVTARCRMYIPWYAQLVQVTTSYRYLKERFDAGTALILLDPDGQAREEPWERLSRAELDARIRDPTKIFGHGFVLASVLLGVDVWTGFCLKL